MCSFLTGQSACLLPSVSSTINEKEIVLECSYGTKNTKLKCTTCKLQIALHKNTCMFCNVHIKSRAETITRAVQYY